ncbi:hypothetical protein [Pseudalkalibacillus caeni]|uniref:FAD/FMN-containing dehydrogenase n=1 Tax=Exobacillus caeni TaxID=2574798 RepID=A0A5R9EX42_9BACL|nr:hypothetical protein [Pseudalkalibacillus caeni]TLS35431.1 hypothetical protein FCL54_20245 [Pseudalkalibacillus caeni]
MKKNMIVILATLLFVIGPGNAALAHGNPGNNNVNFGQAQKYMQEMHPGMTKQEVKEMYNTCHGTNGAAPSNNFQEMGEHMNGGMMYQQ